MMKHRYRYMYMESWTWTYLQYLHHCVTLAMMFTYLVAAAAAAFGPISNNNPTQPRQSIKTIFNLKTAPFLYTSIPHLTLLLPPLDHSRQSTRAAA